MSIVFGRSLNEGRQNKNNTENKNKTTKRDILLLTLDTCNQFWAAGWKIYRQQAQFYRWRRQIDARIALCKYFFFFLLLVFYIPRNKRKRNLVANVKLVGECCHLSLSATSTTQMTIWANPADVSIHIECQRTLYSIRVCPGPTYQRESITIQVHCSHLIY